MHTHQIHAEAINVIFRSPIFHALNHEFAHQRLLRSCLVAAARTVRIGAVGILAIEIIGKGALEIAAVDVERMVIHHVENDADARLVQCLHHLLELPDAYFGLVGVGGIRPLGYIVVQWVIAPVVLRLVEFRLIHRGIIVGGKDMYGVDTQRHQVFDGFRLGECQVFSLVF